MAPVEGSSGPAAAAQHPMPVTFHGTVHLGETPKISGDAVVGIVAAQEGVDFADLVTDRVTSYLPQTRAHSTQRKCAPEGAINILSGATKWRRLSGTQLFEGIGKWPFHLTAPQRWNASRANTGGDLASALGRIKAKTYVMPISHDMFFPPSDCEVEQRLIPGSQFRPLKRGALK